MPFEYFYAGEGDKYVFFRIPKSLMTDERYAEISTDAKLLYGMMLDRLSLSEKNGWTDQDGRLFIYYTLEDISEQLRIGRTKAQKLLNELENDAGLILRKRQGLCRPNRIYVGRFPADVRSHSICQEKQEAQMTADANIQSTADIRNTAMQHSGSSESETSEVRKTNSNKTKNNKTEKNDILPPSTPPCDARIERRGLYRYFNSRCDFEALKAERPGDEAILEEIQALLVDTCATHAKQIRIGGERRPASIVKAQLMKLEIEHIRYVMNRISENGIDLKNTRKYLLAMLYNAPFTMSSYYRMKVNQDLYKGGENEWEKQEI